ncbi:hypothetical protein [Paenibacillus protaetiae]|uniref:DUF2157 domain-containing protein n=1 Tax=Paenibacillus protaetiae TaxID=2509456 RepID=A0A4P6ET22_9BACL|nr:hypothetical protein [Paenibacillus protaetiae]QAY66290.1 hypothetical protein ET464_07620 [Paenibacillus protaetiae]
MNEERRQTIIAEIAYWRRNKLLPDQYCDFLLNLYRNQNQDEELPNRLSKVHIGKAAAAVQKATGKQWLLTIGIFTLISFVVLYFNAFPPALQIAVIVISAAALIGFGGRIRSRQEAVGLSMVGIAMLVLLGGGLYMLGTFGYDTWHNQLWLILGCACLWIVYGIAAKIPALHACGWIAAAFVYALILDRYASGSSWYEAQLYWLPVCCLFGWCSWFFHRYTKQVSAVLFVVCAGLWFMPEIYQMLFLKETAWLQLQLIGKIAAGGGLLFFLRKQWMVWVA